MNVDISSWNDVLLHPVEALGHDGIQARAEAAGLSPDKVEMFGWLLEIAAQASELARELELGFEHPVILRGGTSAQLRMDAGRERVSGDVDILLRGSLEDAERLVNAMNTALSPCAPYLQFVAQERTEKPIGEFRAWQCQAPRQFGAALPSRPDDIGRAVLFEVHAIGEDDPPPSAELAGSAFGLALTAKATVIGLTTGALLGDKLDCLAADLPIGIDVPRYDKHARHIYDITQLRRAGPLTATHLADAASAVTYFTRRDPTVRDVDHVGPAETMQAASDFLLGWGWPEQLAPIGGQFAKAKGFEQYVPKSERGASLTWSQRALDAALLAQAVKVATVEGGDSGVEHHRALVQCVQTIEEMGLADQRVVSDQLIEIALPAGDVKAHKGASLMLLPKKPALPQVARLARLAVAHGLTVSADHGSTRA